MAWTEIPLGTYPDQQFSITVEVGERNVPLIMHLRYNTEGKFWHMDVSDGNTQQMLISNIPLVTGEYPAANILSQFEYIGIGCAVILPVTDKTASEIPGLSDLGTDFILMWGSVDVG